MLSTRGVIVTRGPDGAAADQACELGRAPHVGNGVIGGAFEGLAEHSGPGTVQEVELKRVGVVGGGVELEDADCI